MVPANDQVLRAAIARNAGAVVSLPSAGMVRNHKTRLLAVDGDGFWIEMPTGEESLVDTLLTDRQLVGLSVKTGTNKVVMTTTLEALDPAMRINAGVSVRALRLAWPTELKTVQRRSVYRAKLHMDSTLTLRIWRIPEHYFLADRPAPSTEVKCAVRDLSVGGMNVAITMKKNEPKIAPDQRLRIEFVWNDQEMVMEGRARHTRALPSGEARLGVQFKKLDGSIEGRRAAAALTEIVGDLQREEIRRMRLGLAG